MESQPCGEQPGEEQAAADNQKACSGPGKRRCFTAVANGCTASPTAPTGHEIPGEPTHLAARQPKHVMQHQHLGIGILVSANLLDDDSA
jgi:hypothetical protein